MNQTSIRKLTSAGAWRSILAGFGAVPLAGAASADNLNSNTTPTPIR